MSDYEAAQATIWKQRFDELKAFALPYLLIVKHLTSAKTVAEFAVAAGIGEPLAAEIIHLLNVQGFLMTVGEGDNSKHALSGFAGKVVSSLNAIH